ncbi:MAG: alpha/beta hydrolase family protein [Solirubrobacteraceae bacterium]
MLKKIENHIINTTSKNPIILDVFYKETHSQKPIIVYSHGFKGFKDWGATNLMAEYFADNGFVFVKFNFSYNGGTMTNPIDFPDLERFSLNTYTKEQDDLNEVLNFIETNTLTPPTERNLNEIYLLGFSRGGATSIIKSIHDKRIKKVATLGSLIDLASKFPQEPTIINHWKENKVVFIENQRTNQQMPINFGFYEDFIQNKEKLDILKIGYNLTIPQLIIHGTKDETIPLKEAFLMKEINPKAELFILETNHTFDTEEPWKKTTMPKALLDGLYKVCLFFKN